MIESCPKCSGAAPCITPMKNPPAGVAKFGCTACGHVFGQGGLSVIETTEQLQDVFRGATLADKTLTEVFGGEKLNAATKALLQARLVEYGLQMWNDGLKQGLLLGAIRDGVTQQEECSPVPR